MVNSMSPRESLARSSRQQNKAMVDSDMRGWSPPYSPGSRHRLPCSNPRFIELCLVIVPTQAGTTVSSPAKDPAIIKNTRTQEHKNTRTQEHKNTYTSMLGRHGVASLPWATPLSPPESGSSHRWWKWVFAITPLLWQIFSPSAHPQTQDICTRLSAFTTAGYCDLHGRGITSLDSNSFNGLSSLQRIDLGLNDLKRLPDNIFNGLPSLEVILLNRNPLICLPIIPPGVRVFGVGHLSRCQTEVNIRGGAAVTEGTVASFTVTASPAPTSSLIVLRNVEDVAGSDFLTDEEEGDNSTWLFPRGQSSHTFTIPTVGDSVVEQSGDIRVTLRPRAGQFG